MWNLKRKKEQQMRPYRDAIAQKIAGKIMVLQHNIVKILQQWDRRLSIKQKKSLLLLFGLVCSSYCGYLFYRAVFASNRTAAMRYAPVSPVAKPPPSTPGKPVIKQPSNNQ